MNWLAYVDWVQMALCLVGIVLGLWLEARTRPLHLRKTPPTHPKMAYRRAYLAQAIREAEAAGRRAAREDWRSHR